MQIVMNLNKLQGQCLGKKVLQTLSYGDKFLFVDIYFSYQ